VAKALELDELLVLLLVLEPLSNCCSKAASPEPVLPLP
jgi:hypothetical protein